MSTHEASVRAPDGRAEGRRRRLTRTGALAALLGSYWVAMCALLVGLSVRSMPLASAVVAALGLALLARMAVMGLYLDDRELRCVSWLVTRRVPREDVLAVRAVGYSGFGNEFGDSGMLSMLVVERRSGRAFALRGTVARATSAKRAARIVQAALSAPAATNGSHVETVCRVCGFDDGDERWTGPDGAQYVICPCCGAESGVDDVLVRWVRRYRLRWIRAGRPWWSGDAPASWDPDHQLRLVPPEWR